MAKRKQQASAPRQLDFNLNLLFYGTLGNTTHAYIRLSLLKTFGNYMGNRGPFLRLRPRFFATGYDHEPQANGVSSDNGAGVLPVSTL
jgi:hypothetical protein